MRTADLVSTVIAIWHAVALLHRTDVTTTVVATYGVVGAAFIRKWPQRVLPVFVLIARYFQFYF
jgi:divalent metal cation (Fe/Co/Zn/Cd) transporter